MLYQRSSYLSLPSEPGVYQFLDKEGHVLYVGKAKNLKNRVSSYFTGEIRLGPKTAALTAQIESIRIIIVESELESLLLEAHYIKKYKPRYNVRLVDNKFYPYIRITIKDTYPAVFLVRKVDDPKSLYFGPYPNVEAARLVLKTVRRAFPFQTTSNHLKRICLYHHLGLCPCGPMFDTPQLRKEYKSNIRNLIGILEGKSRQILKQLTKDREGASKKEDYDIAQILQKKITALEVITMPITNPIEYELNPNLRSDTRQRELEQLRIVLSRNNISLPQIRKIECYDISNISGKHATASLVVFVDGEKTSSLYRKFKIRREAVPNDFAMMREVLTRRLRHTEWEYPDVIMVDGGKGQVSSAVSVLSEQQVAIPIIGLAKRLETIVIPERTDLLDPHVTGFSEVVLPKATPVLQLLMRIRDEAHRFAITYHKHLRSKASVL